MMLVVRHNMIVFQSFACPNNYKASRLWICLSRFESCLPVAMPSDAGRCKQAPAPFISTGCGESSDNRSIVPECLRRRTAPGFRKPIHPLLLQLPSDHQSCEQVMDIPSTLARTAREVASYLKRLLVLAVTRVIRLQALSTRTGRFARQIGSTATFYRHRFQGAP
jgi:hypothetical protein